MIIYLLKMIACSAAFYALYHFFFSREKMLVFNRVYLLLSLVASFIIPLITFTVYIPASPVTAVEVYPINDTVVNMVAEPVVAKPDYVLWISVAIASLITLILFIRLVKNLLRLRSSIRQSEKIHFENVQLVLIEKETVPFSFMQNIFINKNEYEQGRVADAVIAHEMAHIQQKHSWDILFVELLQVFTWFNPMLYLYKSAIKTNHEFLADEAVVQQTADRLHYQQLLLQSVYVNNNIPLASSFYFTTKKRLIMLQKTFKRKRAVWAGLAAVPLLALLVFTFSSKTYAQVNEPKIEKVTVEDFTQTSKIPDNVLSTKIHYDKNNNPLTAEIEYKDGKVVKEDISTSEKLKSFEKKYDVTLIHDSTFSLRFNHVVKSPPPVLFKQSIEKLKVFKMVTEIIDENGTVRVYEMKDGGSSNLPPQIKNLILRGQNGKFHEAVIFFQNDNYELRHLRTNDERLAFKKEFGFELPATYPLTLPPPPPPPYSKAAQDSLDKYPVIFQFTDTKENTTRVLPVQESKVIKRPSEVKNMIFIVSDYFVKHAVMIYPDDKRMIEDLSTPKAREEFKKKYGMEIGYKVYPPNEEPKPFRPPLIVNNKTGEKSISSEEMKEYENLMKEMAVKKNGKVEYKFIDGKTQKAAEIYKRMSVEQRKKVVQFPPPPPLPKVEARMYVPVEARMYVSALEDKQKLRGTVTITDKEMKEFDKLLKESVVVIDGIKRFKNGMDAAQFLLLYSKMSEKQKEHYKNLLPM